MRYNVLCDRLQNLIIPKPSQAELGKILGLTQTAISGRAVRNSNFDDEEIEKIESYYNIRLVGNNTKYVTTPFSSGDRIEIKYWDALPDEIKNKNILSVWFDREIIENDWCMNADHLCIVPMVGDKMARYWYPIRNGDILIVDTSQNHILGNGVYFATSQNNTRFWIREMQVLINKEVEFKGFSPSGDTTKVFKQDQLQDADFKLIGKVIKNVSFRL